MNDRISLGWWAFAFVALLILIAGGMLQTNIAGLSDAVQATDTAPPGDGGAEAPPEDGTGTEGAPV